MSTKSKQKTKRNGLMIAEVNPASMYYPTEKGFFLDGSGGAYMQTGGKLYEAGDYNPDIHGLPVPLAERRKKLQIGTA